MFPHLFSCLIKKIFETWKMPEMTMKREKEKSDMKVTQTGDIVFV